MHVDVSKFTETIIEQNTQSSENCFRTKKADYSFYSVLALAGSSLKWRKTKLKMKTPTIMLKADA